MFTLGFVAAAMVILGPCTMLFLGRFTAHAIESSFWGLYLIVALVSTAEVARSYKRCGSSVLDCDRWARFMLGCFSFALVMTVSLTLFWLARAFVDRYHVIIEGMQRAGIGRANCL